MHVAGMRRFVTAVVIAAAAPAAIVAQLPGHSVSVGLGVGIGGPSGEQGNTNSLKWGPVASGSIDFPIAPLVAVGAQVDYWRRTNVDALFVTGVISLHVPVTHLSIKAGAGFGRGDVGRGERSGLSGQLGLVYEMLGFEKLDVGPGTARLFTNLFVAGSSPGSPVLFDVGLALSFR